jgi:hypothetical protein
MNQHSGIVILLIGSRVGVLELLPKVAPIQRLAISRCRDREARVPEKFENIWRPLIILPGLVYKEAWANCLRHPMQPRS